MTDLKLNYPTIDAEENALKNFITDKKSAFKEFLPFPNYQGNEENLRITSKWLNVESITRSNVSDIVECNSANHSLSCVLQILKQSHQSIITEPFTYPAFKSIALNNGFKLLPSEFDSEGLTIEGLEKNYALTKSKLIYLQPTLHNPTCVVMSLERRKLIAEFARQKNILIIEDDAYRFLHPNPPLRFLDLIPENTFHIFSLSKPFNPFIKTSYLIAPTIFKNSIIESVRLSSSGHSSLLSGIAAYLLDNNILNDIILQKQRLAIQLQERLTPLIKKLSFQTFNTSFHIWVKLPEEIKSDILEIELWKKKIMISNGKDFAVDNSQKGERFIRIAFGTEKNIDKIERALIEIVDMIDEKKTTTQEKKYLSARI
jgi:DNA-binding transcriptional MocR family regulator